MPDLQWYPRNLNLIINVEDIVVFLNRKVVISPSFSFAYYSRKCASHFRRETTNESKQFKEKTKFISDSYLTKQNF